MSGRQLSRAEFYAIPEGTASDSRCMIGPSFLPRYHGPISVPGSQQEPPPEEQAPQIDKTGILEEICNRAWAIEALTAANPYSAVCHFNLKPAEDIKQCIELLTESYNDLRALLEELYPEEPTFQEPCSSRLYFRRITAQILLIVQDVQGEHKSMSYLKPLIPKARAACSYLNTILSAKQSQQPA